jgi:hypothetical protein
VWKPVALPLSAPSARNQLPFAQLDRRGRRRRRWRRPTAVGQRLDALPARDGEAGRRHHHPLVARGAGGDARIEVAQLVAGDRDVELPARDARAGNLRADIFLREPIGATPVNDGEVGIGADVVGDAQGIVAAVVGDHGRRGRRGRAVGVDRAAVVHPAVGQGPPPGHVEPAGLGVVRHFGGVDVGPGVDVRRRTEAAIRGVHGARLNRCRPCRLVVVAVGDQELVGDGAVGDADFTLEMVVERDVDRRSDQRAGRRDELTADVVERSG